NPEDSSGDIRSDGLPFKFTTQVTSNVMIRDGQTIVIGGLFREQSQVSRTQVPFLGSMPLAGPLLRKQDDNTTREAIIILLNPHFREAYALRQQLTNETVRASDNSSIRSFVRRQIIAEQGLTSPVSSPASTLPTDFAPTPAAPVSPTASAAEPNHQQNTAPT